MAEQQFPSPEVVGNIPTEELTAFGEKFPGVVREFPWPAKVSEHPAGLIRAFEPLAAKIIDIANDHGRLPTRAIKFTVDTQGLPSQRPQRIGAGHWHQDGISPDRVKLVVADILPTEYLAGELKTQGAEELGLDSSDRSSLLRGIKGLDDEHLGLLGLKRLFAQPGDVLKFNGTHVHRSPSSSSDNYVKRVWLRASYNRTRPSVAFRQAKRHPALNNTL